MKELQPLSPYRLVLVGAYAGYYADEKAFKDRFAQHRLYGEWFEPVAEILDYVAQFPIPNDYDTSDHFAPEHCLPRWMEAQPC